MRKPTYYLWSRDFSSPQELQAKREEYTEIGFRVVTFYDGEANQDIHAGLRALIGNHRESSL